MMASALIESMGVYCWSASHEECNGVFVQRGPAYHVCVSKQCHATLEAKLAWAGKEKA